MLNVKGEICCNMSVCATKQSLNAHNQEIFDHHFFFSAKSLQAHKYVSYSIKRPNHGFFEVTFVKNGFPQNSKWGIKRKILEIETCDMRLKISKSNSPLSSCFHIPIPELMNVDGGKSQKS